MSLFKRSPPAQQVLALPVGSIRANPYQPRKVFDPDDLQALARSIAQVGVLQPLTVRRAASGWELVAGERRLRAAMMAGLATVPCLEVSVDEETSTLMALVENIQRRDLDFWEEALALRQLIDLCHLSQDEAAARVGKSQSAVANKLRLLRLPEDVLEELRRCGMTERHARALLRLDTPELQRKAVQYICLHHCTVAQSEEYIERLQRPRPRRAKPIYRTKDVRLFLNTIQRGLHIMNSAGVDASVGQQETENEILLTIHIPKQPAAAQRPS